MMPGFVPVGGQAAYNAKAVAFNGSSWLIRDSGFSGVSDGKLGTVSVWFRMNAGTNGQISTLSQAIVAGTTRTIFFSRFDNNLVNVIVREIGGDPDKYLRFTTDETVTSSSGWVHFCASWDVGNGRVHSYLNGASSIDNLSVSNVTLDYTSMTVQIGAFTDDWTLDGDIADFFFDTKYIDLSIPANLNKFRLGNRPRYLGANGERPFESQPVMFLTGPAATFHVNKGVGGDFVQVGALTDAPTSP